MKVAVGESPRSTLRARLALVSVALVSLFSVFPWSLRGVHWADGAATFVAAEELLKGQLPYRDLIWQTGPLPVLLEAVLQSIFGTSFQVSILLGVLLHVGVALVLFGLFRQFSDSLTAALGAGALTLGYPHEAHGFGTLSAFCLYLTSLFLALAFSPQQRARHPWLMALAGASCGLIFACRQSNGLACALGLLIVMTSLSCQKGRGYFLRRMVPFSMGFMGIVGLMGLLVSAAGLLPVTLQALFLDAYEKKAMGGGAWSLLRVTVGGSYGSRHLLVYNLLPLLALGSLWMVWRSARRAGSNSKPLWTTLAQYAPLVFPIAMIVSLTISLVEHLGHSTGLLPLIYLTTFDFPRVALTLLVLAAFFSEQRVNRLLSLKSAAVPLLAALFLAYSWSTILSWPERGYAGAAALQPALLLAPMVIRPSKPRLLRGALAVALVLAGLLSAVEITRGSNAFFGPYLHADHVVRSPVMRGLGVTAGKAGIANRLLSEIDPGESCFVYGNSILLYSILQCENPTRLYTTYPDVFTLADAEGVVAQLEQTPPRWMIIGGNQTMGSIPRNQSIVDLEYDGRADFYGPFQQQGPRALHEGIRRILAREYRLVWKAEDVVAGLEPERLDFERQRDFEYPLTWRLYSRHEPEE